MKKINLVAIICLLAFGSAFSAKQIYASMGWDKFSIADCSGPTDNTTCKVQATGMNCFILCNGINVSPVYDSKKDLGVESKILRHD